MYNYSLQRSKLDYLLAEEMKFFERESSKAVIVKAPEESINLDREFLAARARGKSLRSGKRLPDAPAPYVRSGAASFGDEENGMDNISISDSEEDDGFNHWSSNEGRYVPFYHTNMFTL